MRLIFAGTPRFAERALARLLGGHQVVLVLTQPDRPAGRGMRPLSSPVKALALERGIAVLQPDSLRAPEIAARLAAEGADAMIVAAYGLLLPPGVLQASRHGAINIHASLLPRWRGAAPIQRALLAGDRETGVSIMQMDAGLDTGPVFLQRRLPIEPSDDFGTLHDRLAALGAEAIVEVLTDIANGRAQARPQSPLEVTYARKIEKAETRLRWDRSAEEIERAVRAFRPSPGSSARLGGEIMKIWRAHLADGSGPPGTVLESAHTLRIACGGGALAIDELQPAGRRIMSAAEFLRGRPVPIGTRLE